MAADDLSDLPAWVRWIAQDRDGGWWGFEHEPNEGDYGWYENEVGRVLRLTAGDRNDAWRMTLRKLRD